jgi:hypothetical protein
MAIHGTGGGSSYTNNILFNASLSNAIYGNSDTIQPQAIKYYFYIVVGTVSKTDIQIDIDNVMSDLALKADKDLSNVSPNQAFKSNSIGWNMPDYSAGVSKTDGTYTENVDGFLIISVPASSLSNVGRYEITIGSTTFYFYQGWGGSDYDHPTNGFFPIPKNTSYRISGTTNVTIIFYPCKGAN